MALPRDIGALKVYLETQEYPRLQMALMVAGAGLGGFLLDVLLWRGFGLGSMAWRFALSVAGAYGVFLALLRLWLMTQGASFPLAGTAEAADLGVDLLDGGLPGARGGGVPSLPDGGGSWLPEGDLDEWVVVLIALAAVAGLLVAAGWLVYQAPTILAELILDGALSAGLYRRLRTTPAEGFAGAAFRLTATPFLVVAILLGAAGWALQARVPEARTLKQAVRHWRARPA